MFISFRSFNHDYNSQDYLEAVSFYIVVFKDGVLTVSIFLFKKIE
jgi:magnesium transporter